MTADAPAPFDLDGYLTRIGYVGDRLSNTSSIQSLSPQYTANLAASAALPLLRGLFWSEPWTAVKLSDVAYQQSLDEFRRDLTDLVLGIELTYWNLVAQEEGLRAADKSLDAANAVLEQTRVQHEVGVVSRDEALRYAQQRDLDLVEVAPDARPPVCRVLDYSKYKYEQEQKAKSARRHQKQVTVREIKLRPKIAENDYETKKGHVERFLRHQDKVKVTNMWLVPSTMKIRSVIAGE